MLRPQYPILDCRQLDYAGAGFHAIVALASTFHDFGDDAASHECPQLRALNAVDQSVQRAIGREPYRGHSG